MHVLGIESSCDETSAAVVEDGVLTSNVISSQYFHSKYGGVVPELASRAHLQAMIPIINQALQQASIGIDKIDICAVTQGPGLIGSLLVGLNFAKGFALSRSIPLYPIHHIEAHIFSTFLTPPHPDFPFLCLVVSGGHTLIIRVDELGQYKVLGSTRDDAVGEAFDKVAKILGLDFPGGPVIDQRAQLGNSEAITFPRATMSKNEFDFSFSGIKTSVLYYLRKNFPLSQSGQFIISDGLINDIAASFQRAIIDVLTSKIFRAADQFHIRDIAVVGGVSANNELKQMMHTIGDQKGKRIFIPLPEYSTDNAAMVALLGYMKVHNGIVPSTRINAFARSPKFSFS